MALVVAAAGLAAAFMPDGEEAARVASLEHDGPAPLDGMTFEDTMGPDGKPKDVEDTFVFANGTFLSKECESRCGYPARPYTARKVDGGWRFESITQCPYKDATIVWRGTVENARIEGIATWTMRRWYWSIERDFAFEAQLESASQPIPEDE